jgi:RNA binding exosome subunit
MSVDIRKKKNIMAFLTRLLETNVINVFKDEVEERTDDECVFHFRLEKQRAFEGFLELAVSKDVIDCALKAAAYPAKRAIAVASLRETFQELLSP